MTETSSRLELTRILSGVLKKTNPSLIAKVSYLLQGKLRPDFEGIELGMATKSVMKAMEKAYGADKKEVESLLRKTGDLGDVAQILSEKKKQQSFVSEPLSVENVYSTLDEIARTTGAGSSENKLTKLTALLNSSSGVEAKFLTRLVTGKLRLGVADYTVLDSLAQAFTGSRENREILERAYNLTSDLGLVAEVLARDGPEALGKLKLIVGRPIRPMLAERLPSPEEILNKFGGECVCEYKLDGERVQAHKKKTGEILLFSRRLEQITSHYGDVAESLKHLQAEEFVIEGEVVAVDDGGKYLPFQELMHRRRKYGVKEATLAYPAVLNLFDILFLDGSPTIDKPYEERRKLLESLIAGSESLDNKRVLLVPAKRVREAAEIDSLMEESLNAGCEGLMVKDPKSPYRAGSRGFSWIKFKPEYRENVRDTIDLVVVGANHGLGRRAGQYGAFLLAAYDKYADVFRTTTKVGTGFRDADLAELTKMLREYKINEKSSRVDSKVSADDWFEPKLVIEIIASEITLSPIYTAGLDAIREGSGLALRFPKFTGKIREDKAAEDATTVKELLEMYKSQRKQFKDSAKS
jgi:DNA ligase 1